MQQPFIVGQAIWGRIRFPDGHFPQYDRPYLIVGVGGDFIEILTVSTVAGKEWKLNIPTNREIVKYNPPFPRRTFVKLDSLQTVRLVDLQRVRIAAGILDQAELEEIIDSIIRE